MEWRQENGRAKEAHLVKREERSQRFGAFSNKHLYTRKMEDDWRVQTAAYNVRYLGRGAIDISLNIC